ncbi:hypothetical protein V2W45_142023 [Cenococcum geophilum]
MRKNTKTSYMDRGQPGSWNELDMLEVGNGGMTNTEHTVWILYSFMRGTTAPLSKN